MESTSQESRILLALKAIKPHGNLSIRRAATVYNVPYATLRDRRDGIPARQDIMPKSQKLTELEEQTLIQHILDLDSRSFPPRLSGVEDMANQLLRKRDATKVGVNWASNFVKRRPELTTRFTRKYDYQRAQCEDPDVIHIWFELVKKIKLQYGITDDDMYNFDETGFMMGIISTAMVVTTSERRGRAKMAQPGNREWSTVIQAINSQGWAIPPFIILAAQNHLASWYTETGLPTDWVISTTDNGWTTNERGLEWIQHFNKCTISRTKSSHRLLILDGHESHHSTEFELYCKEHKIVTLCMPPHSSHLLQPLDVGCFGPLKKAYGRQIENLIRAHITHVTKVEFLSALKKAFFASMTGDNIRGGFRGSGLVPLNPESVLSKLDIKLRTPTPPAPPTTTADSWVPKTPQNPLEANSQSEFIKTRIANHQNSSPTSIYQAVDQIMKGAQSMMHSVALLKDRVETLERANQALSKRRRAKRTRIHQGGSLTVQDGQDLLDQKSVDGQVQQEMRQNGGPGRGAPGRERRCGTCGKTGHNARTCQEDGEMSNVYSSE
jgi:hypothetical protein